MAGLQDSFRVVAWVAPGYGQSAPLRVATPGIEDYADALTDLMSALDIGTATIVGSSRDCRRLCESLSGGGPLAGSVGTELSRAVICGAKRSPENLRRFCMGYSCRS
ncbi:alpha/beta fold hydrolase [Paraburkholderia sp. CI3]|uniref:alpha/beta fold hydrolase n=1 Tax=Paraburkholderia sp. CI3 TaxID=2991060 RepID=UPI003D223E0D